MHRTDRLHAAAAGALLGTFAGDALGMPYEDAEPGAVPERLDMAEARLGRGTYTDDTQQTIALTESLLRCDGIDAEDLAISLAAAFDPARGYGRGTTQVVRLWHEGVPVAEAARRVANPNNGAAMRAAPIGVRFARDPGRCAREAARAAAVTHDHPEAIDAAVAQACAVAAAVRRADPLAAALDAARTPQLRRRLERVRDLAGAPPPPAAAAAEVGATIRAVESVPAALLAAAAHDDFEAALTYAVRCGGDADTVGAMAGAVAGARLGARAIPRRWLDALEDGPKGRAHVERLAARLADAAARG